MGSRSTVYTTRRSELALKAFWTRLVLYLHMWRACYDISRELSPLSLWPVGAGVAKGHLCPVRDFGKDSLLLRFTTVTW